jgi:hypothetical protein
VEDGKTPLIVMMKNIKMHEMESPARRNTWDEKPSLVMMMKNQDAWDGKTTLSQCVRRETPACCDNNNEWVRIALFVAMKNIDTWRLSIQSHEQALSSAD